MGIIEQTEDEDKTQTIYENSRKVIEYKNGLRKEIWPDGYSIIFFANKDIK
jgi:hypothetical protein